MLLGWVKRGLGFVLRFLLRFFFRSLSRAMGCFFACFRVKDNDRRTSLIANSSRSTDVLVSRNSLSSVFQSQERENCAIKCCDGVGSQGDDLGLKDEAKFLKACGTLAGTPVEIRKASEKRKVSPSCDKHSEPSRFHSWLPSTSVEKLQLDIQPFNPSTPVKLCRQLGDSTDSFEHTPNSCISDARDNQHDSLDHMEGNKVGSLHIANRAGRNAASVSPYLATDTHRKNKSVRFQCDTGLSSCGSSSDDRHLKKNGPPNSQSANKPSPYPTPLKLFDEIQTPGTVCPATLEELPNGKPRVRSQFVYTIHKPDENTFQCKILEEKDLSPEQDSSQLSDSVEQAQNATPTPEKWLNQILNENESKAEVSLSTWLKPAPVDQEERNKRVETAYSRIPHFRKTPADRPIVGAVAAHFEHEDSHIRPPKWWDGNGIPNSTTKYKEDQKVNWHATPFEERLEKALTEESFIPQRQSVRGKPMHFDDIEESDTALPQLQSSTNPQFVESF